MSTDGYRAGQSVPTDIKQGKRRLGLKLQGTGGAG
jgi:hypothetical protein